MLAYDISSYIMISYSNPCYIISYGCTTHHDATSFRHAADPKGLDPGARRKRMRARLGPVLLLVSVTMFIHYYDYYYWLLLLLLLYTISCYFY